MAEKVANSLSFQVTTIAVNLGPNENSSGSEESEENSSSSLPEIYSRFIEAKKISHKNLCSYISFEQLGSNKALIISESHSYNLDKLLTTRM